MKYIKLFFYYLIQFTWGLPQNIIGFLYSIKFRYNTKQNFFGAKISYHNENWGGVSLGIFIIINGTRDKNWIENAKVHEYGHTIQSLILGPFYLFVIGIPSMIWCISKKWQNYPLEKSVAYFDFYPEKWANYLGEKVTKLPAVKE